MKIIIAGGRDFKNYSMLQREMNQLVMDGIIPGELDEITIISGMAKGADTLAVQFAKNNRLQLLEFPADWGTYGNKAGFIRNTKMAEKGDFLLAFWDGHSRGTKHMIDIMASKDKPQRVISY